MTALPQAPRPTWKQLLAREQPLLLPFAHDALSARLIERAGFAAYGIGGFALVGARHALPASSSSARSDAVWVVNA